MSEWDNPGDTAVDIDPGDLIELEADAATPVKPVEQLPGYELGRRAAEAELFAKWDHLRAEERRKEAVRVLQVVRDHLLADGADPAWADKIVKALARRARVKLD